MFQRALLEEVARAVEERLAAERTAAQPNEHEQPKRSEMTPKDKSQFIRAHGVDAYNRLPWR